MWQGNLTRSRLFNPDLMGWLGMNFAWPRDYHSLSLTCINFNYQKVTSLTNHVKIMIQELCKMYSLTRGWHNFGNCEVVSITVKLVCHYGEKLRGVQEEQQPPKTLPWGTPDTTLTRLLRQPSITTYCDHSEINCIRTDSTERPMPNEQNLKRIPWKYWPFQKL